MKHTRPPTPSQLSAGINSVSASNILAMRFRRSGLYGDELAEATVAVCEGMTRKGWIVFTWLEPELFYIKTTNQFSSQLELTIDLPTFGSRAPEREFQLSDMIELRGTSEGYELILLTREERYSGSDTTRGKGLVLFRLPYKFLWSLQGDPFESHKKAKEILTAAGFAYQSDAEVSQAWDYRNEYGSLKWWDV